VLFTGLAIFVGASALCGSAHSMLTLVLFRSLQGVGAGCLLPVTITVVGDMFPMAQRARLQGLFSGMWGVASIVGPLLGAALVSTIGWRWIFGVNLPIGLAAAVLLWSFRDRVQGTRAKVDYPGALLLTAGVALLLFGFGTGGGGPQLNGPALGAAVVLLALFLLVEMRSQSPTIPLHFLANPVIGPAVLTAVIAGTLLFGLTSYIPFFVQAGLGGSAYQAGAALAPLTIGWPVASVISGRIMMRFGYQRLTLVGTVLMVAGTGLLLAPAPVNPIVWVGLATLVIGLGMGTLNTPLLIMVQSVVEWGDRGAVTALNQFSRTIGGAIGVALMGTLLQARIHDGAIARGLDPQKFSDPLQYSLQRRVASATSGSLVTEAVQALWLVFVVLSVIAVAISVSIVLNRANRTASYADT
jgi:MFS family permease